MFLDIDLNLKPQKPQLFLCKPNKQIIGKLKESFNINLKLSLRQLNELSFSLPYEIEINHELVKNDNINKLKERYLIKLVLGNYIEWFIINELTDSVQEDQDIKEIHTFSLGYELRDKLIRDYEVTSYNATQVLTDALSSTIWNIDYIDADFDIMYRSFEVANATILDFVYQIAETFNALVVWNTENRTISFYQPDNIGNDKGFIIKYGKYLKSLNKVSNADEMATRLKVFGKDGLSIQRVNPTGSNFIEDFSYFMYPYAEDENGNVIHHSDYMSDELCKAIIAYQNLLESKKGDFDNLLNQKETLQDALSIKETELFNLETELKIIEDNLDIAQSTGVGDERQLKIDKKNKEDEIIAKKSEITTIENNIANVDNQIEILRNEISIENNFTTEQIVERNQFIIEKEWSDENYIDDKELYEKAIEKFQEIREPQIVVDLSIINFLEVIEEQLNWDKLQLGDIINVLYEKLNINIKTKIIEIDYDFENTDITLTIANTTNVKNNEDEFLKDFYNVISTSTTVDMNKFKWQTAFNKSNEVSVILNEKWDSAKREITSGVNNSVTINDRGITISNSDNPLKYIRMTNGVIGLTQNGGNDFGVAIDATGVYAEKLIGQILAGNNLTITNDTGTFSVDGNGVTISGQALTITGDFPYVDNKIDSVNQSITDLETDINNILSDSKITAIEANSLKVSLNEVVAESINLISEANSLGITTEKTNYSNAINDLNTYLTTNWIDQSTYPKDITSTDRTNINNKFKTVQDTKTKLINKITAVREKNAKDYAVGKGVNYNGVVIDTTNGVTVTGNNGITTMLNATEGITIGVRNSTNTGWSSKKFYADADGNLSLTGSINCTELRLNGTNIMKIIRDGDNQTYWLDGSRIDSIDASQIRSGTIATARLPSTLPRTIYLGSSYYSITGANNLLILDAPNGIRMDTVASMYENGSYNRLATQYWVGQQGFLTNNIYVSNAISLRTGSSFEITSNLAGNIIAGRALSIRSGSSGGSYDLDLKASYAINITAQNDINLNVGYYNGVYIKKGSYAREEIATKQWVQANFVAK